MSGESEFALVLQCCRASVDPAAKEAIPELVRAIGNWQTVITIADRHDVTPVLRRMLEDPGDAQSIPSDVLDVLREREIAAAAHNLAIVEELLRILVLLGSEVRAIAYKGPMQALGTNGRVAGRQSIDLDLLIDRNDVLRAKSMLMAAGFRRESDFKPSAERRLLRTGCEYNFESTSGVFVELHWQILPRAYGLQVDFEGLWRRSRRQELGGARIPVFSAEDLLLVLSMHASKHSWSRLKWLCDIAQVLRGQSPDVAATLERAQLIGARRTVLFSLYLVSELLGVQAPWAARDEVADFASLAAYVRSIMNAEPNPETLAQKLARHRFLLRLRDNATDRLRYCVRRTLWA